MDAAIRMCMIRWIASLESFALPDPVGTRSRGRTATLVLLGLCVLGGIGWLAIRETPAAQRVVDTIKPYDPLQ
ncbi:MAG: hypothetical protein ACOYOH_24510 [Paracraurococcus sp.]